MRGFVRACSRYVVRAHHPSHGDRRRQVLLDLRAALDGARELLGGGVYLRGRVTAALLDLSNEVGQITGDVGRHVAAGVERRLLRT